MNEPKYKPTLCVGADVHKDEIALRAVDKALGHEVLERFRVTNNRPGAQSAAASLWPRSCARRSGMRWTTPT